MSESDESQYVRFEGKRYLRRGPVDLFVIYPSTAAEIKEHERRLFSLLEKPGKEDSLKGKARAVVLSDSGEKTEIEAPGIKALWKLLAKHLAKPEARWLEFKIEFPESPNTPVFTLKNRACNVGKVKWETDGNRKLRTVSLPVKKGRALPRRPSSTFREILDNLGRKYPMHRQRLIDSYFTSKELRAKGVVDNESFEKHFQETQDLEKFYATESRVDHDGKETVIWKAEGWNRDEVEKQLWERMDLHKDQRNYHWETGTIPRSVGPEENPLFAPSLYVQTGIERGRELIESKGEDSPEAKAFAWGLDLGLRIRDLDFLLAAHEAFKSPHWNNAGQGKAAAQEKDEQEAASTRIRGGMVEQKRSIGPFKRAPVGPFYCL